MVQQRFTMCNIGDRPVAIALTYHAVYDTATGIRELFVLYFTGQSSILIPWPPLSFLIVVVYIYYCTFCVCWGIVLEYHIVCTT